MGLLQMVDLDPLFKVTGAVGICRLLHLDMLRKNEVCFLKFSMLLHHLRGYHGIADG